MTQSAQTNKSICAAAYFGLFFLLTYFYDKTNPDYRFHANQGLILFIFTIIIYIVGSIIGSIVFDIVRLVALALTAFGVIFAIKGENRELPIIGKFRLIS